MKNNLHISTASTGGADPQEFSGPECPSCHKPTLPGSRYCYRCGCFFEGGRALEYGEVEDREIDALTRLHNQVMEDYENAPGRAESRKLQIYCVIGLFAGGLLAIFHALLGFALMAASLVLLIRKNREDSAEIPAEKLGSDQFQNTIDRYVTPGVLAEVFDRVDSFDPKEGLSVEFIQGTNLIYQGFDAYGTSNLIHAVHNGISIQLANVHLQQSYTNDDDRTSYQTIFLGPWIVCDLGTPMAAPVYVLSKSFGYRPTGNIETDHAEFNRRFYVFCRDAALAFQFLTPRVMEAILQAANMCGGKISLLAMTDGRICIAVNSGHSLLKAYSLDEGVSCIRDRMQNELAGPLALVDALNSAHLNR